MRLAVPLTILSLFISCATAPKVASNATVRRVSPEDVQIRVHLRNIENRPTTPVAVNITFREQNSDGSGTSRTFHPAAFVLNKREEHDVELLVKSHAAAFTAGIEIRAAETGQLLRSEQIASN